MIYFMSVSTLMYDVTNNFTPPNISNLFISSNQVHKHDTRFSCRGNYYVKYSHSAQQNKSFSKIGVRIYNSIPTRMLKLTKNNFKKMLNEALHHMLSEADDYINLETIIREVTKR